MEWYRSEEMAKDQIGSAVIMMPRHGPDDLLRETKSKSMEWTGAERLCDG